MISEQRCTYRWHHKCWLKLQHYNRLHMYTGRNLLTFNICKSSTVTFKVFHTKTHTVKIVICMSKSTSVVKQVEHGNMFINIVHSYRCLKLTFHFVLIWCNFCHDRGANKKLDIMIALPIVMHLPCLISQNLCYMINIASNLHWQCTHI